MIKTKKQNREKRKKKILVTGGKGTLGSYVSTVFKESNVILAGKDSLNIIDKLQVMKQIEKYKPDLIIHLAALTDVDFCEKNEDLAMKINFEGTRNIVDICKKFDTPLVYISTATVFDGTKPLPEGYTEDDIPSPLTVYGKSKVLGEKIIEEKLKKFLIVRIGWLIGGGRKEKKFISLIRNAIEKGETVCAVDDIFGTISYGKDIFTFIKEKLRNEEYGLYHFACKGSCSRFDMAMVLKEMINKKATVVPVSVAEFKKRFPAPRPKNQIITSTKHSFNKPWNLILKRYITSELLA